MKKLPDGEASKDAEEAGILLIRNAESYTSVLKGAKTLERTCSFSVPR